MYGWRARGQTRRRAGYGNAGWAGDIAGCKYTEDSATARLLGTIPGTVYTLGDNVYTYGTAAEFRNCYDPTWGKYKNRTKPTAGNHDYYTAGAKPYFNYFGRRAGRPTQGYYSLRPGGVAHRRPQQQLRKGGRLWQAIHPGALAAQEPRQPPDEVYPGLLPPPPLLPPETVLLLLT